MIGLSLRVYLRHPNTGCERFKKKVNESAGVAAFYVKTAAPQSYA